MNKSIEAGAIEKYGYTYFTPFVCTFGIIINLINFTVLASRQLKESPYTYLTGLACFDLLTLLFTLTTTFSRGLWLESFSSVQIEFWLKKLEKNFFLPSANLCSGMSASITVALTFERYYFIKFPMRASGYCSAKNARIIILIIFLSVAIFRLPLYFFWEIIYKYPDHKSIVNSTNFAHINNNTDAKFIDELPIGILVVSNLENFQNFYFLLSLIIFEIVPFFMLSILNLTLIFIVKNSNHDLKSLGSNDGFDIKATFRSDSGQSLPIMSAFRFSSFRNTKENQQKSLLDKKFSLKVYKNAQVFRSISFKSTNVSRIKQNSFNPMQFKLKKRKRDQVKLTRTLIAVICLALISQVSSIITYPEITTFLVKNIFPDYMRNFYKLQAFVSNMIVLMLHSMNFFLFCAFNRKYLNILRQKYACVFKVLALFKCKKVYEFS